jgi:hypothetical protein
MNIHDAMAIPYTPDQGDGEDYQMTIPDVDNGVLQRSEDGAAFFFCPGAEEGTRIAWGKFDPHNPDYQAPHRPRRGRFC